jgi:hypothetical protein
MGIRSPLVVAASVLLLAGCSTPLPAGPTDAELDAFTERSLTETWQDYDWTGDRPEVARVRYISNAEYTPVMAACMAIQGFDSSAIGRGLISESRAWFTCQAMYPVDPHEYRVLSDAQLRYLYEYRSRWTVPCLGLHGYTVTLPSYDEFAQDHGLWNALYSDGGDSGVEITDADYSALDAECGIDVVGRFPE